MRNFIYAICYSALVSALALATANRFAVGQDSSILVPKAAGTTVQPTLPAPSQPYLQPRQTAMPVVIDESVPAPQSQPSQPMSRADNVHPAPCVKYDTNRSARRMYACNGSVSVTMVACNPANGCAYEIPLCIPACCTSAPTVSSRCGLFGRGIVEYCWPCGFSAEVKFRNIGDVKVDYDG